MLGIDRRAARYTWTVVLVLLLLACIYQVRRTLFVFVLALLFAYLLSPLVDILDHFLGTRSRTPALALAYVLFVGALVLAGFAIGSRVVDQANALAKRIPDLLQKMEQPGNLPVPEPVKSLKQRIFATLREQAQTWSSDIVSALPKASLKVLSAASDLVFVVVVPILGFFFLKDGRTIRSYVLELVDRGPRRELLEDIMADIHELLAHYMRALLTLCSATFVFYSIFFTIIGVPYGILLASVAFALELIPMIGPLTAGVLIVSVAGATGSHWLAVLVFLLLYRVFQDYVLSPHLMRVGVELHPLLVIFGVFAGAEIAGIAGTFLSVPVLALVRILYRSVKKARTTERLTPVTQP